MNRLIAAALGAAVSTTVAQTENETELRAFPEPPDLPPASYQGETVEPEVTIIETEKETIYEYRVRGLLYMVKVQPQVGPPYFLLDTTGDGQLDVRKDRVWNNAIPQWVLFSW
ncbi:MAG: DUF2782 domain-containing protein [Chromatiaceae bacterium]|jgi:hypothetical protein|nr:DUF2782 domain-containing protein [Chromatiaceae bacterium]